MSDLSRWHYGLSMERQAEKWLLGRNDGAVRNVIARNFRIRGGEIDLVLEEGRELVFVEVRSRAEGAWVSALESVTLPKLFRLRRAIEVFLSRYRGEARSIRVDVLAWDGRHWSHARDIQLPSVRCH